MDYLNHQLTQFPAKTEYVENIKEQVVSPRDAYWHQLSQAIMDFKATTKTSNAHIALTKKTEQKGRSSSANLNNSNRLSKGYKEPLVFWSGKNLLPKTRQHPRRGQL